MADITMCVQKLCPNAGHCRTVQAKPGHWQNCAAFKYTVSEHGVECDSYWPTTAQTMDNKTRSVEHAVPSRLAD